MVKRLTTRKIGTFTFLLKKDKLSFSIQARQEEFVLNNRSFLLTIFTIGLLLMGGCGSEESGVQFLRWPIIGGVLDNEIAHNGIVAIQENNNLCTGTLITRRVVLTAAHCTKNTDLNEYTIYFGNNVTTSLDSSLKRSVAEVQVADGYDPDVIGVKDIALMRLSSDSPESVTPIPHLPHRLEITQSDVDSSLVYVGYGKTTNVTGALDYGVKRTMTHAINWVCVNVPGDCGDLPVDAIPNTICENQETTGICLGDSGGPALIERNGKTYVAGVTSFVGQNCEAIGCSTKVDAYEDFIADFAHNKPGASCSSPYDCNSGYCAHSVCCESACAGSCLTCGTEGKCQPAQDGTSCADNDRCNGDEACQSGVCTPGTPLNCDDGNPSTIDSCDQSHGCLHTSTTGKIVGGCDGSGATDETAGEDKDILSIILPIVLALLIFWGVNYKIKRRLKDRRKDK